MNGSYPTRELDVVKSGKREVKQDKNDRRADNWAEEDDVRRAHH